MQGHNSDYYFIEYTIVVILKLIVIYSTRIKHIEILGFKSEKWKLGFYSRLYNIRSQIKLHGLVLLCVNLVGRFL